MTVTLQFITKKPSHEEDGLQMACFHMYRLLCDPMVLFHHSVNEGKRGKRAAALAKAMGQRAGFTDVFLAWPIRQCGFIELKSVAGRFSDSQTDFRDWCMAAGFRWGEARSVTDFKSILQDWGVPFKVRPASDR